MKIDRIDEGSAGLSGLIVPVPTPFDCSGALDRGAFAAHLDFLAQHGVRRIMVNGTTGEFYSLLPEERQLMLEWARECFDGFIVLHVGGCGLVQNKMEVRRANELGADAVAALPPIYPAGLSSVGIINYLQALSAEAQGPFLLYNFPKHTGNALTPEILQAVPHAALKDSLQNLSLIQQTPRYFVGSSTNILPACLQGGVGFVSASANVRPDLYVAFERCWTTGDRGGATALQEEIKAFSAPFSAGGVPLLKRAIAQHLSVYPVQVRLPLS
jgi:4-hydroxy-tetrahydrodipicolinate synthase